jgi:hypothetical protein
MENSYAVAGWADINQQNRDRIERKLTENQFLSGAQVAIAAPTETHHSNQKSRSNSMAKIQALRAVDTGTLPSDISLKDLRQNLGELRRKARLLEEPAVEQCLTLALELTSSRRITN